MNINSIHDLARALRNGPYAWPGGYPCYFIMGDGEPLSFKAAWAERRTLFQAWRDKANGYPDKEWLARGFEINWEDYDLVCAHTGENIEAAYGDEAHDTQS